MTETPQKPAPPINARAQSERAALCDLFAKVGPDAPTLCEGWATRDLAAHLVIREGRLDTSMGAFIPPLKAWTKHVQDKKANLEWPKLIDKVRTGPPRTSMMRIASVDGAANTLEFVIHHEDVRRATPGWTPRDLDPEFVEDIWARLAKFGRLFRNAEVGVILARPDGSTHVSKEAPEGRGSVTLTGEPLELALRSYGRMESHVEVTGAAEDIVAFNSVKPGF